MTKPWRRSLTSTTLRAVALRIAVVIGLTALLAYWHLSSQAEKTSLQTLEKYIHERSLREREVFKLARDNHTALKKEVVESFRQLEKSNDDPVAEFNKLVKQDPDGAFRSPRAYPGMKKDIDIWIAKNVKTTPLFRRKVVSFSKVLAKYAPAFHVRFTDTYIALAENANIVYWPEFPNWSAGNPADFDYSSYELWQLGTLAKNPERKTLWSGVYWDDAVKDWMVTASTPIDDSKGNFAAIIGHDVMIGDLIQRTTNEGLYGTYNILINADGRLIAHPKKMEAIIAAKGNLTIQDSKDPELIAIYEKIKSAGKDDTESILDQNDYDQFIAVGHIPETNWYFVTVYPKSLIRKTANQTALVIVLLGFASLILEMIVLYWIFRKKISLPLQQFIQATHDIEKGREATSLPVEREDEIGDLSRCFDSMSKKIHEVSAQLKEEVEQRTRELHQVELVAIKNAQAAEMAETANNILHKIGNTLNSVNLSMIQLEETIEKSPNNEVALEQLRGLQFKMKTIEDIVSSQIRKP